MIPSVKAERVLDSDAVANQPVPLAVRGAFDEGEVVILAVKPSGWYVFLLSAPIMLIAAIVAGGLVISVRVFELPVPGRLAVLVPICMVAACLRLFWACSQWTGRLYVLTNRRALRVTKGLLRTETFSCPLTLVKSLSIHTSTGEKFFGLSTLDFEIEQRDASDGLWTCLANAADVETVVAEAVSRVR